MTSNVSNKNYAIKGQDSQIRPITDFLKKFADALTAIQPMGTPSSFITMTSSICHDKKELFASFITFFSCFPLYYIFLYFVFPCVLRFFSVFFCFSVFYLAFR